MKLSCLQENLNRGLGVVGRAVATRTTLPITNNVLLATDEGRLKLVATNLEMAISCWIGAKIEEEGAITVPARLLTEFVSSLPSDTIDVSLSPQTKTLGLKCARFEARISGVDAKDFPPIPSIDEGIATKVEVETLRQGINQVVFAAATEESRPVLTGVCAQFEGDSVTLAAADGFRLAVYKLPVTAPVSEKTEVIVNIAEFLRATKTASIFARDGSGIVRLMITPGGEAAPGKLTVSARSEEIGDDVGEIDATVEGDESKIAFNGKYLTDVLSVLNEAQVALETTNPSSPGLIRPVGTENYTHVVMPMFVQW